jgi:glycosyltransferase involved in cell wall biosynthesis
MVDPLLVRVERHMVSPADLAVAVFRPAADAAHAAEAAREGLIVVPNGLTWTKWMRGREGREDALMTRRALGGSAPSETWHNAEVLVALPLPPEVELTMIGDGSLRSCCQTLAEKSRISHRIEWTGAIPHGEALQKLSRCDVPASPRMPLRDQEFFGSPAKIFEYMAIRRPIVASGLGELAEVLEAGRTARLVASDDPQALADGIADVLALPDRRAFAGAPCAQEGTLPTQVGHARPHDPHSPRQAR